MKLMIPLIALGLVPLAGCQTLKDARESRGRGTTRTFDAPFETVWKIVPSAANDLELSISNTDEEEKYFLAQRSVTAASWGEKVAIFVSPLSEARTSVEVVSRSAAKFNITAVDFEKPLLDRIGEKLRARR